MRRRRLNSGKWSSVEARRRKERERKHRYRASLSDEKRATERDVSRERMASRRRDNDVRDTERDADRRRKRARYVPVESLEAPEALARRASQRTSAVCPWCRRHTFHNVAGRRSHGRAQCTCSDPSCNPAHLRSCAAYAEHRARFHDDGDFKRQWHLWSGICSVPCSCVPPPPPLRVSTSSARWDSDDGRAIRLALDESERDALCRLSRAQFASATERLLRTASAIIHDSVALASDAWVFNEHDHAMSLRQSARFSDAVSSVLRGSGRGAPVQKSPLAAASSSSSSSSPTV